MKKTVCFLLLMSALVFAKTRNWQDALILEMTASGHGSATLPVGTVMVAVPLRSLHYIVETADLRMDLITNQSLNITLNKKTSVAIDGAFAYLIDDAGKEKKLKILLKTAKTQGKP